jgi:Protein of unknown function (DUF1769)
VYTGQLFEHEIKNMPGMVFAIINQIVNSFSRLVSSSTIVKNEAGCHCIMFPVILGAQAVHVARPGEEPSMDPGDEQEDVTLMLTDLNGSDGAAGTTEKARLRHFEKEEARQVRCWLLCSCVSGCRKRLRGAQSCVRLQALVTLRLRQIRAAANLCGCRYTSPGALELETLAGGVL